MTSFLLTSDEQLAATSDAYDEVFLWTRSGKSTFTGTLGPHLSSFGAVRTENVDFVRIALAVFAADRSVTRHARRPPHRPRSPTVARAGAGSTPSSWSG